MSEMVPIRQLRYQCFPDPVVVCWSVVLELSIPTLDEKHTGCIRNREGLAQAVGEINRLVVLPL